MKFQDQLEIFLKAADHKQFDILLSPILDELSENNKLIDFTLQFLHKKIDEDSKNVNAFALLGILYRYKKDYPNAIRFLDQAVQLGSPAAMTLRGNIYQEGASGVPDYPKAVELFERAMQVEYPIAIYMRAIMHNDGQGGQVNYGKAAELLESNILKDYAPAYYTRGEMHSRGVLGVVNNDMAAYLFRHAYLLYRDEKNPAFKEALKALNELPPSFTVKYHQLAVTNKKNKFADLIKTSPKEVLKLISNDSLLSDTEKYFHLQQILKRDPQIIERLTQDDEKSLDLIGSYYFKLAEETLERGDIAKACEYLKQVPSLSSMRGEACFQLANHMYMAEIEKNRAFAKEFNLSLDEFGLRDEAFSSVRPYLEEGSKLANDGGCKLYYSTMLQYFIDPKASSNPTADVSTSKLYDPNVDLRRLEIKYHNMPKRPALPLQSLRNLIDSFYMLESAASSSKPSNELQPLLNQLKNVGNAPKKTIYQIVKLIEDELLKQRFRTSFFNNPVYDSNEAFVQKLNSELNKHHYSRLLALTLHDLYQRYDQNLDRRHLLSSITDRVDIPSQQGYKKFREDRQNNSVELRSAF